MAEDAWGAGEAEPPGGTLESLEVTQRTLLGSLTASPPKG